MTYDPLYDAAQACNDFGNGWSVNVVRDGALICTLNSVTWKNNCNTCDTWRMVVWKNGAHEYAADQNYNYDGIHLSTTAGKYYGGHENCHLGHLDNFPLCGEWGQPSGKYIFLSFENCL